MCGIAGILSFNGKVDPAKVKAMTDVIAHRGPDGEGLWASPDARLVLGHRRLAIIDLSDNGKQPMTYNGRFTITFNGEIYNYSELRSQLVAQGYTFVSDSDTEVLLAMYQFKGPSCLDDLDGMFAFAIWDEQEKTLFCARDRFGEKPFYYSFDGKTFVFASEIKQFWALGSARRADDHKLLDFFNLGLIETDDANGTTFFSGISQLGNACCLTLDVNAQLKIQRYWDINLSQSPFNGTLQEAAAEFRRLLTESVKRRLRADVTVGSSLSGGLDSSSIVMLIDQEKKEGQTQDTFSARFRNFDKDEGPFIEKVVRACRAVNARYVWPDENYFSSVFEKVIYAQDEPIGSASIVAQYAVMELAKQHGVVVLLDGQGADEFLAGYPPYYPLYFSQLFYHARRSYVKEVSDYRKFHGKQVSHANLDLKETIRMRLGRYRRLILGKDLPVSGQLLKQTLRHDTLNSGLATLLRYADRNSMAHAREVRLPFLSHQLVEFAFTLPDHFLLQGGWTKYVLRQAMKDMLPSEICWRKDKVGYEPPQQQWMKTGYVESEFQKAVRLFKDLPITYDPADADFKWRMLVAARMV